MYGYVLQDWITIRSATATSIAGDIIQGESTWMGFSSFQDIVIWLDIREIVFPTGGSANLTWFFETAPSKDNNLFVSMPTANTGITLTSGTFTPGVQALTKSILATPPNVPLATWLRWRVSPNATTGPWDATFRILVAANRVVREVPQQAF